MLLCRKFSFFIINNFVFVRKLLKVRILLPLNNLIRMPRNVNTKYATILWSKEGTRSTIPMADITSANPTELNECTAKFNRNEFAGIILIIGSKAVCEQATKFGIEKTIIEQVKRLEVDLKKVKKSEAESSNAVKKTKEKLDKAGRQLKKTGDLKKHFVDLLNASHKIEAVFNSMTVENRDALEAEQIYDSNFPSIKVTKRQADLLNLASTKFNPANKGESDMPSQGAYCKVVLETIIPDIDWLNANYSELKKANPNELAFAMALTQNLFKDDFKSGQVQQALRCAKYYKKKVIANAQPASVQPDE